MAQSRPWNHPSVRALLRGQSTKDAADVIRRKAREVVALARQQGWSGPPFDPKILASLLGIKCHPSKKLFSAEAQLTPQPNRQLLLEFNPDRPDGRRNYSICHEIIHTLFDDCYERVHHRMATRTPIDPDDEIEQLCQIGAAEILMPLEEFAKDLHKLDLSLASVSSLRERYAASREAVIRRMVFLSDRPCAAVFFSNRLSPREKEASRRTGVQAVPKMRILYSVPSKEFPLYLPTHKSVAESSCVNWATEIDVIESAREQWEIEGFGVWPIEAMRLATPDDSDDSVPTCAALVVAE